MGTKTHRAICDQCGKEIYISSSQNARLKDGRQKKIFCSKECKTLSQHTGGNVKCATCGKIFYRRGQHILRHEHQFCSQKCARDFRHQQCYETRVCEICGENFSCSKSSKQRFCSTKCQSEWQKRQVGPLSTHYRQVEKICSMCGRRFMVRNYRADRDNLFCSIECSRKWFKDIFCKNEHYLRFRKECSVNILKDREGLLNTRPQQIIDGILAKNGIAFEREYSVRYYSVDNYLPDYKLMIEVMGDFWHCNPTIYNRNDVKYDIQKSRITKDKAKHTYILNEYGIEVLYLWEKDINDHPGICEWLIMEYIKNNGVLENYHSFYYTQNMDVTKLSDL